MFSCIACGRSDFKSARGLAQHQTQKAACRAKLERAVLKILPFKPAELFLPYVNDNVTFKHVSVSKEQEQLPTLRTRFASEVEMSSPDRSEVGICRPVADPETFVDQHDNAFFMPTLGEDMDIFDDAEMEEEYDFFHHNENASDEVDEGEDRPTDVDDRADGTLLCNWRTYVDQYDRSHFKHYPTVHRICLDLLAALRKTKAPLETYDVVMEWYVRAIGDINERQTLTESTKYISRKKLYGWLSRRYNMTKGWGLSKIITLGFSKARVKVVYNDARMVIQSLLTDPRIQDKDYLFGNDPFQPPPSAGYNYVEDINTGLSYTETYKRLITDPEKQILLPIVLYIDGAVTGQFANLPITSLDMTFGIFNRKARERPQFWRSLGYVPSVHACKREGLAMLVRSGHVDAAVLGGLAHEIEDNNEEDSACKAQDLHQMLAILLQGVKDLQDKGGFFWDLTYKGKTHRKVWFVPYVAYVKCDTDEADKLCGAFTSRCRGVSQLCRYCKCPTDASDNPLADYGPKTVTELKRLQEEGDTQALKSLSQQNIRNAFHGLRFGMHNNHGIHGATPMDMLHTILLGLYKYVRDCLFKQLGDTSKRAKEMNNLAALYGVCLHRQSDRNKPVTDFSQGVRKGKLMAKEFRGVMLVLLCAIRSTKGKRIMEQCPTLREVGRRKDWMMLLETLLQWERWLKQDTMEVNTVKRAKEKHKEIMYLMRKIANRTEGMGLKIVKFHAILHIADDILNFGVPEGTDTGSNEAGHKRTKKAALLTQKQTCKFEEQVERRMREVYLLDLFQEERKGRPLPHYHLGFKHAIEPTEEENPPEVAGATWFVNKNDEGDLVLKHKRDGKDGPRLERDVTDFVYGLEKLTERYRKEPLYLRTEYTRNEYRFRSHPFYFKKPWRDWALVDWGEDGRLPMKLYGFVDLRFLPKDGEQLSYGGVTAIEPDIYAIAECAEYVNDDLIHDLDRTELVVPLTLQVASMRAGRVTQGKYWLTNTNAIIRPLIIVPDVGGAANAYFQIIRQEDWKDAYCEWLDDNYMQWTPAIHAELGIANGGNYNPNQNEEDAQDQNE